MSERLQNPGIYAFYILKKDFFMGEAQDGADKQKSKGETEYAVFELLVDGGGDLW